MGLRFDDILCSGGDKEAGLMRSGGGAEAEKARRQDACAMEKARGQVACAVEKACMQAHAQWRRRGVGYIHRGRDACTVDATFFTSPKIRKQVLAIKVKDCLPEVYIFQKLSSASQSDDNRGTHI